MSKGTACRCTGGPDRKRHWAVYMYRCNYSAFNGYHRTPSEYSGVGCLVCGASWRTRARYVDGLPLAPPTR